MTRGGAFLIDINFARSSTRLLGCATAAAFALLSAPLGAAVASAAQCPDIEVVFARGTTEAPGVGGIGQAFVDAIRSQAGGKSVDVYAVNYPASFDFPTAADGIVDASNHVRSMAADCPKTRMVLGGYSQGAAVIGYVTSGSIPDGATLPTGITGPMPADVADNVAAVALFGKPSTGFLNLVGAPPISIGPLYAGKTIDLCNAGDPVCQQGGDNRAAHGQYAANGMVGEAASFATGRL